MLTPRPTLALALSAALIAGCAQSPPRAITATRPATSAPDDTPDPPAATTATTTAVSEPARVDPPPPAPAPSQPSVDDGVRRFRGHDEDALVEAMRTRPVVRVLDRFNSSTLVYRCDMGEGLEIAFKPARRGEHGWWRHEAVAYRLARVLGIRDRVPPAVTRRVPVDALRDFNRGANLRIRDRRSGMVEGVAIFWMPELHHSGLHTPEARERWSEWMDPRIDIPPADRRRALQIAALIAFDYLQANFDRWNSANVAVDERRDLVFRDNNRGWFLENLRLIDRGGLSGIRRIPAWLWPGIQRATPEVLRAELERDGMPLRRLLRPRELRAYGERQRALVAQVNESIARYGRERVLLEE